MIARISGTVLEKTPDAVVLDVGGIGYLVHTTLETKLSLEEGAVAELYTHLAVRENALDLYGFRTPEERSFFELLISISGVGPKSAVGILSMADVATLRSAVGRGDITYLTSVSGIGKKSAERIVLELSDKLAATEGGAEAGEAGDVDVLEALTSLGYSTSQARKALKELPEDVAGTSERLKAALQHLGGNGK